MAKRYVAGGNRPAFRTSDRVAVNYGNHNGDPRTGEVFPVTVRKMRPRKVATA